MHAEAFLERLGFGRNPADARLGGRVVLAVVLLYGLGYLLWYPELATNTDERMFLNQTQLLLRGTTRVERIDPFAGTASGHVLGTYAIGVPLLMAPFVWAAGPRGAYLLCGLSVIVGVLILARWLRDEGRSPVFALLALGFPATLVMGRVAMSDAPSFAVVSFGLWLFWRGIDGGWRWWLGAGFVAGTSMIMRVTNCLPFIGLFAGTVLRREKACWALIAGGLAGVALRLLANQLQHGDAFFERDLYQLRPETILSERLPLYLLGLVLLVPGGLVAAAAYRGRRRPELIATVAYFVTFYLLQDYSTQASSFGKRVVLGLRYFLELLPLLVFAVADAAPRAWRRLLAARSETARIRLQRLAAAALGLWLVGLAGASFALHGFMDRWSAGQARIAQAIAERVDVDTVVVTNRDATRKFMDEIRYRYLLVNSGDPEVSPEDVVELSRRYGEVVIVLLDRSDSDFWRAQALDNDAFIEALDPPPRLELDRVLTPTDRLRIWRLGGDG